MSSSEKKDRGTIQAVFEAVGKWYEAYTGRYHTGDASLEDAVRLKYEHTRRVCSETERLCGTLGMDADDTMLAGIAALLHDVARFEQFRIFRTFSDAKSCNHAELALLIISRNGLLSGLEGDDADTVLTAIRHHNAITVPAGLDERHLKFCRLLRDADKLDIYRIVLDQYRRPDPQRAGTVEVGIPEGTGVSPGVCSLIMAGKPVPYTKIVSIADFKLIQLGWVFDLNFPCSFRCVRERGYIGAIGTLLPDTPEVRQVIDKVEKYLEQQCTNPPDSV